MQYSPKLKRVMEEIKQILEREQLAGVVVIHEPGFSEYVIKVNPAYSCAAIESKAIRFKLKKEHYGGDSEKRNRFATDTCNMMHHLSRVTGQIAMNLLDGAQKLDNALEAEHFGGDHTSHESQNN